MTKITKQHSEVLISLYKSEFTAHNSVVLNYFINYNQGILTEIEPLSFYI